MRTGAAATYYSVADFDFRPEPLRHSIDGSDERTDHTRLGGGDIG